MLTSLFNHMRSDWLAAQPHACAPCTAQMYLPNPQQMEATELELHMQRKNKLQPLPSTQSTKNG